MSKKKSSVLVDARDLKAVVDYLWSDEEKHWEESGKRKGHVFQRLINLRKALVDSALKPKQQVIVEIDKGGIPLVVCKPDSIDVEIVELDRVLGDRESDAEKIQYLNSLTVGWRRLRHADREQFDYLQAVEALTSGKTMEGLWNETLCRVCKDGEKLVATYNRGTRTMKWPFDDLFNLMQTVFKDGLILAPKKKS